MIKRFIATIIRDIFVISFLGYLVLFLAEWFKTGFVTNYFNINIILIICFVSGIITSLVYKFNQRNKSIIKDIGWFILYFFVSVAFGVLTFNTLVGSGRREILITVISAVTLLCSLVLIYKND